MWRAQRDHVARASARGSARLRPGGRRFARPAAHRVADSSAALLPCPREALRGISVEAARTRAPRATRRFCSGVALVLVPTLPPAARSALRVFRISRRRLRPITRSLIVRSARAHALHGSRRAGVSVVPRARASGAIRGLAISPGLSRSPSGSCGAHRRISGPMAAISSCRALLAPPPSASTHHAVSGRGASAETERDLCRAPPGSRPPGSGRRGTSGPRRSSAAPRAPVPRCAAGAVAAGPCSASTPRRRAAGVRPLACGGVYPPGVCILACLMESAAHGVSPPRRCRRPAARSMPSRSAPRCTASPAARSARSPAW